ncbi:extracellular solute-binding protein [Paenibacillus humicola]|uniref:ABC transporter substrate-binding protein n=1 Tax=Paenibacillus humicola TaxID=3110540 RepID=UPI00237A321D|nr:extracellular solute-binding protein [Paenibacillus humicola]
MNLRRFMIPCLIAILAAALTMSGCSASTSITGSDAKSPDAKDTGGKVTLRFMTSDNSEATAYKTIISDFEKQNPNIKVEMTVVPGTETFITALKAKFSANDAPDLYSFQVGARTQEFAAAGLLADLSGDPQLLQNIQKKDLALVTYKGGIYAAPTNYQATGVFINQDVFSKYGLTPPENFQQLIEVNKAFQQKGLQYPMVMAGKDVGIVSQFDFQYLSTVVLYNQPDYYKQILDGKLHFNSPLMKKMFDRYAQLRAFMSPDSLGVDADTAVKRFIKGEGAMLMDGTWRIQPIRQYAPDMKVIMIPSVLQEPNQERVLNVGVSLGVSLTKSSKHPEEAKKFLAYILTPEVGNTYATVAQQLSTIKGVNAVFDPMLQPLLPYLNGDKTDKTSPHADLTWIPGIKDVMKTETQKWFLGDSLDSILNDWEAQHQRLMKENPDFVNNYGKNG